MLSLAFLFNVSCDDELDNFKTFESQTLLSLQTSSFNLSIPEEDLVLEIPVFSSTLSGESRTFPAIVSSATEGTGNEYAIGSVTIPANEYDGILTIDFDFSEIGGEDGEVKELIVALNPPDGVGAYNNIATINYFREIVCNDMELTIISDRWATETYFTLENADGTIIVERSFPFSADSGDTEDTAQTYNVTFTLPNGDYIFKLGDAYGDGQVSTNYNGSYLLTCSILTHAQGDGAFSGAVADPFTGAPNATVEATAFSVNP